MAQREPLSAAPDPRDDRVVTLAFEHRFLGCGRFRRYVNSLQRALGPYGHPISVDGYEGDVVYVFPRRMLESGHVRNALDSVRNEITVHMLWWSSEPVIRKNLAHQVFYMSLTARTR